jgi:hypothetical protein
MKLCIRYKKSTIKKFQIDIIKNFILELQKKIPLVGHLEIEFLDKRNGNMTTGSYTNKKNLIKVLFKERMLADVLRTLSHEWAHCYDHQKKHIKDRNPIGGKSEDYANETSGEITKRFIKKHPKLQNKIFSQD